MSRTAFFAGVILTPRTRARCNERALADLHLIQGARLSPDEYISALADFASDLDVRDRPLRAAQTRETLTRYVKSIEPV